MKRALEEVLLKWKSKSSRRPLLLRGARQVGKTYLVETFGKAEFEKFHNINFEFEPEYAQCFMTFDPVKIIEALSGRLGERIEPGKSLLFLDEIQNCPNAIMALRYFKEKMPNLHVIGAGSLLEFALRSENFSMPVGRVEYLYLPPLFFKEFLQACGHEILIEALSNCTLASPLPLALHTKLLELVKYYLLVGGMPEAVSQFIKSNLLTESAHQQTIILATYRDDFGKYANSNLHKYLQKIFEQTPLFIGQQIQYSKLDPDARSRELKYAIQELVYAGVLHRVYATAASGLPLHALINEKKFKLLYLDIGLANRATRLSFQDLLQENINLIHRGAIAEQFVGQELLAHMPPEEAPQIHYWARDKKGSQAEVDYVININSQIIPIEVKAGATGNLKSLHMLMDKFDFPLGLRISELPLKQTDRIASIPFYLLSELPRLLS